MLLTEAINWWKTKALDPIVYLCTSKSNGTKTIKNTISFVTILPSIPKVKVVTIPW